MTAPLVAAQPGDRYRARNLAGALPILLVVIELDGATVVSWDYSVLGAVDAWPGFAGDWTYEKVER